jgi:hypothetical protein
MMSLEIVSTTLPPAINAPAHSKMAATNERAGHSERARANGRTDIVGDVVSTDGKRHVAADHGGYDHPDTVWRGADLTCQDAGNREEQKRDTERRTARDGTNGFFQPLDLAEVLVERGLACADRGPCRRRRGLSCDRRLPVPW